MNITLTWDLFIVVFFAMIVTYSFIIGKTESVKVIISTYISIVTVQGLGNLVTRFAGTSLPLTESIGVSSVDLTLISAIKLILLITAIIFLAIRAGFDVKYVTDSGAVLNAVFTALFGFATAGLLLSTILVYISGLPLLDTKLVELASLSPIIQQSQLMQMLILYQDIWFAFPAFLLISVGFWNNK